MNSNFFDNQGINLYFEDTTSITLNNNTFTETNGLSFFANCLKKRDNEILLMNSTFKRLNLNNNLIVSENFFNNDE